MEPKPPRRTRFQIHLSTAIVMMFVAGLLINLNIMGKQSEFMIYANGGNTVISHMYGWPFVSHYTIQEGMDYGWNILFWPAPCVFWFLNTVVALTILFVIWLLCEWLICRRAAQKNA